MTQLLTLDGRDHLIVEECDLPFILMEAFWEIFKVALSKICNVLHGQKALNIALPLILLDEDCLQEQA